MNNNVTCRKIEDHEDLSTDNLKRIAKLIYDTDKYIYPCMFGSIDNAISVIEECIKSKKDKMFNIQNLYIAEINGKIVGLILWIQGALQWTPSKVVQIFDYLSIKPPKYFEKVCEEYFDSYSTVPNCTISIMNLCVDEEYRSKLIGTQLLSSFIREHPYSPMELYVLKENKYAYSLYKHLGFKTKRIVNGFSYDSKDLPCIVMEKGAEKIAIKNEITDKKSISMLKCLGSDCTSHCCKSYSGFEDRLIPIDNSLFTEIILLPTDVESIKNAGYEKLLKKNIDGHYIIATHEDGTCYALRDGKCDIYDFRPSICKAYPLYLDMFVGISEQRECPAVCTQETHYYDKDVIESLFSVYEYWIQYYRNKYCGGLEGVWIRHE